ncbi:MAG: polysaccharide deacetylase family protein [Clostridia bacterium]|nr:polysaccharide deacetylase family protein [Clostridia bacterium]
MKNVLKRSICLTLLIFLIPQLCCAASAGASKCYNWSFKRGKNGERPSLMFGDKIAEHKNILALGREDEKNIYLTFDAGYPCDNLTRILDVLKKHSAPGAFFILPAIIKFSPETALRMANEGHLVCNHSYTHKNVSRFTSVEPLKAELTKLEDEYRALTGKEMSKYFRPPEGAFSKQTLDFCEELGYKTVFWSFAYADWDNNKQKSPEWAKNKILSSVHNGMVMLLHPNSSTNALILDDVLTELENRGYSFRDLDHLKASLKAEPTANSYELLEEYKKKGIAFSDAPEAGKVLALTFDDGPDPNYTPLILDILKKYGVKGTFFVLGSNAEKYPDLIRRIIDEGHEIGIHTYSHLYPNESNVDEVINEIKRTEQYLLDNFAYQPKLFRPPGGAYNAKLMDAVNEIGYKYVLWSWRINTLDWSSPPVQNVVNAILDNVSDGSVILLHDAVFGNSPTPGALDIVIPRLQSDGWSFSTVSDIIPNLN